MVTKKDKSCMQKLENRTVYIRHKNLLQQNDKSEVLILILPPILFQY